MLVFISFVGGVGGSSEVDVGVAPLTPTTHYDTSTQQEIDIQHRARHISIQTDLVVIESGMDKSKTSSETDYVPEL